MANTLLLEQQLRVARTAALIVNVQSRRGERVARRALTSLQAAGYDVTADFVRNPDYLRGKVRTAVSQGHRLVILGGGDGSISSVVGEMAYQDAVLGVLPLGTGNSFALSLGIPPTLPGALDVLLHGAVATVDLGRAGSEYFANIVDLGMTAEMAWRTSRRLKRILGKLAYLLVGFAIGWRHRPFHAVLRFDGQEEMFDTHEIIVANGRFYGDTLLDAHAALDDHCLIVYTMSAATRFQLARIWASFFVRRFETLPCTRCFYVSSLAIDTDPPQYLDLDGENTRRTPTRFAIEPNALHVLVPPGAVSH